MFIANHNAPRAELIINFYLNKSDLAVWVSLISCLISTMFLRSQQLEIKSRFDKGLNKVAPKK